MPQNSSIISHIPPSIIKRYGMVILGIGVIHINIHPFIIAVSKHIKFFQVMRTRDKKVKTFMDVIWKMKSDYILWGFKIKIINADRAFDLCHVELSEKGIALHCCDTNSHVPFIERGIGFVKERIRCAQSMLPKRTKWISARLMRKLVVSTVKMINSIKRKGGVHSVMSPRQIVTGRKYFPLIHQEHLYALSKVAPKIVLATWGSLIRYTCVLTMKEVDILYTTLLPYREAPHVELLRSTRNLFQWPTL